MSIKEIIKNTALLLGREDVIDYFDGKSASDETLRTLNYMTGLVNLVINELACTYIPMVKTETVAVNDGKIYYKNLSENALNIINVFDTEGNEVYFEQTAEFIKVNYGSVAVEYEFSPPNYDLNDVIGYQEKDVPSRVLSYGLCAEFCICEGRFDQAVTWHKRYVDAISEICLPKNARLKQRRWA